MKKIVLTLIAVLSMSTAFAENENMNATNAYSFSVNMKSLSHALMLDKDQVEAVNSIHSSFAAQMLNAGAADKVDRKRIMDNAVKADLRCMHAVLDADQFKKYRAILNATIVNRGLMNEMY